MTIVSFWNTRKESCQAHGQIKIKPAFTAG
jgi:hypothetical protein